MDGALTVLAPKIDYFALVTGPPGHGKSSLAAELAAERLAAGRWVVVQDENREFGRLGIEFGAPGAALRALADAHKRTVAIPRCVRVTGSADAALELAVALGEAWNRSHAAVRAPIACVINEGSSFTGSGATWIDKLQERAINQRRHLGLELVYCLQRPGQLPLAVWDVATHAYLFRHERADVVRKIENGLGLSPGRLDCLQGLPRHRYVTWSRERGLA